MTNILAFIWDPNPVFLKVGGWPIMWYGVLFMLGFMAGYYVFLRELRPILGKKAVQFADKFSTYMIVGTVLGARLGHLIFYERPERYLRDPVSIFRVWEGGLASHGAAVGILIALYLFQKKYKEFTWLELLDRVAAPTALAAVFIRLGNFVNQEIVGTVSNLPWAVTFGHAADGSIPVPRHPVQLYEAAAYLLLFLLLFSWKKAKKGQLIGLFLMAVFGFRFFIEFWKEEQSHVITGIAQALSIPLFVLGLAFYRREKNNGSKRGIL